jgi:hypothetical protein
MFVGVWFLFASAPTLPAQSNAPAGEHRDRVHGTVINSFTHQPIAHALVRSPDNRFATLTDDRGQFEFEFPASEPLSGSTSVSFFSGSGIARESRFLAFGPNRPNQLMAEKPGFLAGDTREPAVSVVPDQQEVTILLNPEALIVGHIVLPYLDYLDRVRVELYRRELQQGSEHWIPAGTTQSRADGSFRFAGLAPGAYKLFTGELLDRDPLTLDPRGQLFGYPPAYYPSSSDFAAAEAIQLSPGMTFQANLKPIRQEYYPVKLPVLNAANNIQVEVCPQGHPGPGYSLSFYSGEAMIEGSLPNGTYTIHAISYGPDSMNGLTSITVAGGPATGATLVLLPNSSIKVSVREDFQDPNTLEQLRNMNGAQGTNAKRPNYMNVTLQSVGEFGYTPSFSLSPPGGTDDESLVIENVQPGSYRVQAMTYVGYVASMTSGGTDLLRKPLVVSQGGAPPAIEITLRDDGAQVDGTVEGFAPRGSTYQLPAVHFVPLPDSSGQFRVAWANGDGEFQLPQLAPGGYRVLAFERQRPELEFATEEELSRYDAKSRVIEVAAGQKEHVKLPLIQKSER